VIIILMSQTACSTQQSRINYAMEQGHGSETQWPEPSHYIYGFRFSADPPSSFLTTQTLVVPTLLLIH